MGLERRNRVAATCASCGGRIAPRRGVVESRHGAARAVHEECRGPVFGSAPRPRSRPFVEPLVFSAHSRVGAQLAAHHRGAMAAALVVVALGLTTLLAVGHISDEPGGGSDFAVVDYELPTTTAGAVPSTTASTVEVPDVSSAAPVEVAAEVVTRPPQPVTTAPPSTQVAPTDPPVTVADVAPETAPPTTSTVAPSATTTAPTTTPPTTTPPTTTTERRSGERDCDDDDRRGKCRNDERGRDDD
jgi:hypothetical protein